MTVSTSTHRYRSDGSEEDYELGEFKYFCSPSYREYGNGHSMMPFTL